MTNDLDHDPQLPGMTHTVIVSKDENGYLESIAKTEFVQEYADEDSDVAVTAAATVLINMIQVSNASDNKKFIKRVVNEFNERKDTSAHDRINANHEE